MSETRMVSADTSTTCTGLALYINGELKEYIELSLPSKKYPDTEERMSLMAKNIVTTLSKWKADMVYIEIPQGAGGNVKLARQLGEMLGVVRGWCASHNADYTEMEPSEWRMWAGFKQGKLTRPELKQMSIDLVKERHGIDVGDDVADAINIGYGVLNHFTDETLFD